MQRMLMGMETEFAFTGLDDAGAPLDRDEWVVELLNRVRERRPHLLGGGLGDLFLGNGARLYVDCGRHPEFSTPECATPHEIVKYVRAGEEVVYRAACDLEGLGCSLARACVFKCNVDYVNVGATWGSHESYLYRNTSQSTLARELMPHLVSRVVYAGAGGLNPKAAGIEFTLSPRVAYLEREISSASTNSRGIYHTKDETLSSTGYHRLHVLSGESLCSHVAEYLRVGCTALIVKLIEAGHRPGTRVSLVAPLPAMQTYVADAACVARAPIVGDCMATAIEIQRHYLEQVEQRLDGDFMPEWAGSVCRRWREVLDALERDPTSLAGVLDWSAKLAVFQDRARRRGLAWESLPAWSRPLERLREGRGGGRRRFLDSGLVGALFRPGVLSTDEAQSLWDAVRAEGKSIPDGMDQMLSLRHELCEIDTRFGQLGPDGIFGAMDRAGVLNHRIVEAEEIEAAIDEAPPTGRARLRGEQVRLLASRSKNYSCGWRRIVDKERSRVLDLSDPFEVGVQWRDVKTEEAVRRS